jgi:hypothetical protein
VHKVDVNILWLVHLVADRLRINAVKSKNASRVSNDTPGVSKPFTAISAADVCAHIECRGSFGTPYHAATTDSPTPDISRLACVPNVETGVAALFVEILIDAECDVPQGKSTNRSNRHTKSKAYSMFKVSTPCAGSHSALDASD